MRHSATSKAPWAAALLAALALGGCSSTSTYGTGESPEVAIFREMTGGMLSPRKEPVVYQPRAPLVLPPSAAQLPAPAPAAEVANAQWPDDPDQGADAPKLFGDDTPGDDVTQADYQRLKPLAGVARAQREASRGANRGWSEQPAYEMVNTKKQREAFQAAVNDVEGISQERRYLTDPPDTVRQPAATAPQQFEEIDKKKEGNFLTRLIMRR
jgi:hypothetical protein